MSYAELSVISIPTANPEVRRTLNRPPGRKPTARQAQRVGADRVKAEAERFARKRAAPSFERLSEPVHHRYMLLRMALNARWRAHCSRWKMGCHTSARYTEAIRPRSWGAAAGSLNRRRVPAGVAGAG